MTSIKDLPKELINIIVHDYDKCEINIVNMKSAFYRHSYDGCRPYINLRFNINIITMNSNIDASFLVVGTEGIFDATINLCDNIIKNGSCDTVGVPFHNICYIDNMFVINNDNKIRIKCKKEDYVIFIKQVLDKINNFIQNGKKCDSGY